MVYHDLGELLFLQPRIQTGAQAAVRPTENQSHQVIPAQVGLDTIDTVNRKTHEHGDNCLLLYPTGILWMFVTQQNRLESSSNGGSTSPDELCTVL